MKKQTGKGSRPIVSRLLSPSRSYFKHYLFWITETNRGHSKFLFEFKTTKRTVTSANASDKRPDAQSEEPPPHPPDISCEKRTGKERMGAIWNEFNKARRDYEDGGFYQYVQQQKDAVQWAAHVEVTLKLSISWKSPDDEDAAKVLGEIQFSKEGNDTWRSVIDNFCAAEGSRSSICQIGPIYITMHFRAW